MAAFEFFTRHSIIRDQEKGFIWFTRHGIVKERAAAGGGPAAIEYGNRKTRGVMRGVGRGIAG